ncbi:MAG: DUF1385 domain-containing protein [Clostridia bacterium]|nr:DUF1385 domain-containing protein [Clostridia bacterium]
MKKNKENNQSCRLGKVGGAAVLEGVMMNGAGGYAVAVRREDKSISVTRQERTSIRKKYKILNLPIIRGVVGMIESMALSMKALNISAEAFGLEEEEPSKFEKWLEKKFGKSLIDVVMVIGTVLGVVLALGLFMFLPDLLTGFIDKLTGNRLGWAKNLVSGFFKIAIFVAYLLLVSLMKDIRRTFEYHGAEHKSIFCYEAGEELTPENAAKYSRFHPRCGTSFLFIMLIVSILIFSLPFVPWDNKWLRLLIKLPLLPVSIGVGFEFIQLTGKHDNLFTRALSAPGRWMQRITTREPDLEQLEIAIIALKTSLPDQYPEMEEENARREAEYQAKKAAEKTEETADGFEEKAAEADAKDGEYEKIAKEAETRAEENGEA